MKEQDLQNLVILPKLAKVNNMLNKVFSSVSEAESYLGYLEERIAQNFDLELINERNQLLAEIYTMERGGCKLDLRKENERLRNVAHVTKTIPKKESITDWSLKSREVYIDGDLFTGSYSDLAKKLGIANSTLQQRIIIGGYNVSTAQLLQSGRCKPCKAFGKTYATTKELAADYGLSVHALNYHRRKTNDLESAIRSALEARERKK